DARCPTKPTTRYVAPTLSDAAATRLDGSAMTLTDVPPSRSRTIVHTPADVFFGLAVRRPVAVTRCPSLDSVRPERLSALGVGVGDGADGGVAVGTEGGVGVGVGVAVGVGVGAGPSSSSPGKVAWIR